MIRSWIHPIRHIAPKATKGSPPARGRLKAGGLAMFGALLVSLGLGSTVARADATPGPPAASVHTYPVKGTIQSVGTNGASLVVRHQAVPGYMDAMTMPFRVKDPSSISGLRPGDEIAFQLHVTDEESWIDHIVKTGSGAAPVAAKVEAAAPTPPHRNRALLDFKFTDELGRAVSLNDFRGEALAITFFFTRCPVPDFCPRLSRNFQEASQRLAALPAAPTNWHFISVTFDPDFDTPEVLREYARRYQYDPARWSFLTGPHQQILELAQASGVEIQSDSGLINHNFRTLIVDAHGHLQTTFPFGGDLSDMIVREMLKAAAVTQEVAAASSTAATAPSPHAPSPMSNSAANPR